MSDSCTVETGVRAIDTDDSATGHWIQDSTSRPWRLRKIPSKVRFTPIVISFLSAPATAINDIWYYENKNKSAVVTVQSFEERLGQLLSWCDALAIAGRVLKRAESERIDFIFQEALRGIQWEDDN
ncbi:MAG: hypothetical protein CVT49_14710 [candidate division Zixibacteria bacterium HGW-Zixibacteria-1]|nr:MAG: hypothetical protein CVT49_14710 [candidate division Zixibacteria bacterium HGW-Zixibacteria-1]